ncbi:hypothetical protein [Amycolatopsis acididurans]|uniref:hypothetical protein n=1 Tax=Amycolatopsis acididurans TaxID=2724524 RepID=UPI0028AADDA6|nr:hypothetical protein [Amycolatopsis acididurans]
MRPGRTGFLVTLAGLVVGLAGCGQQQADVASVQSGGPGLSKQGVERQDAAARWADGYCVAVGSLVDGLATMPTVDPSTPRRAVQTSSDLLGSMIGGLDNAKRGLQALPPSPVAGGDSVRTSTITEFDGIRARAAAAKQRLDAARNAPSIDQRTLGEASGPLGEVSRLDLLAGFQSYPELATAAGQAPVCQQLTARASATPTVSTTPTP